MPDLFLPFGWKASLDIDGKASRSALELDRISHSACDTGAAVFHELLFAFLRPRTVPADRRRRRRARAGAGRRHRCGGPMVAGRRPTALEDHALPALHGPSRPVRLPDAFGRGSRGSEVSRGHTVPPTSPDRALRRGQPARRFLVRHPTMRPGAALMDEADAGCRSGGSRPAGYRDRRCPCGPPTRPITSRTLVWLPARCVNREEYARGLA